ncbi:MAG TPA: hypothetical protein ENK55_11625, partial [Actinobacteria bacterium]|nr:hypothetical protein [Actinomycetota bacterium]
GAAGARIGAEAVGLEIVYDGEGAVLPGQDQAPVISEIVNSGADWIYFVTSPGTTAEILGGVVAAGADVMASGAFPAYDFRLLDTPVAEIMDARYYQSLYTVPWGESTPMNDEMMAALAEVYPDRRPSDSFIQGWHEGVIAHEVLKRAIANGDLTRAGIVAAANSLEEIDFGGSAPNQRYAGDPNEKVTREIAIYKPTLSAYMEAGGADQTMAQEGGTTGSVLFKDFFVSDAAKDFDFTEPCYSL